MATTTPNYGWDVPTSTDYVKDGATAIETLGDDIDSTLYTALGGAYPGLRLIKKQTIGSAVSTVTVTSAFSATYDNYKIIVSGGVSNLANQQMGIALGATTSGYYFVLNYNGFATPAGTAKGSNSSNFQYIGAGQLNGLTVNCDLLNPFLTRETYVSAQYTDLTNTGNTGGYLNNTTSYTAFTLSSAGTMTGGTIYVYGYGAS